MPNTFDTVKQDVIRHDIEYRTLSEGLSKVVTELKELAVSLRCIAVMNEKIENINTNLKRIETEVTDIRDIRAELNAMSRTVYGAGGRNGLTSDVDDLKKMLHRAIGALTLVNILIGVLIKVL